MNGEGAKKLGEELLIQVEIEDLSLVRDLSEQPFMTLSFDMRLAAQVSP